MYIGIDFGGTNIAAGLVDEQGEIICKLSTPTLTQRPVEEMIDDMICLCHELTSKAGCGMDDIEAVGIGCPGTIDNKNGVVVYANNISMTNVKLAEMIQSRINKPVNIENDANAAALGEYIVNGNNAKSFVFITLGTGVGGGVIIDGRLYRGFNSAGGEMGHIIVESENGLPCTCGNRGCWEVYASATALISQTKEEIKKDSNTLMRKWMRENGKITGRTAFDCAKQGDRTAQFVVEQYIKRIGNGLISILNIFQPERIVIGGGISYEGEYLLKPLRKYVYAGDYNKYREKTKIEAATLFNDAGIIGAALSTRQQK